MCLFILMFSIITIIYVWSFYKLIIKNNPIKIKIIMGTVMFIMFIICTIITTKTIVYNTNSITNIINDYKSNKIKEIIIIENQDTTYKYKY